MNHSSERQSPRGSTACSRHCSRRCVLVKVPFFSTWVAAGRKKTSVRDVGRRDLAALDLGRVVPEGGRLDLDEVAHHEPVEAAQRRAVVAAVGGPDRRVLAHDEQALDRPVDHPRQRRVVGVVAGQRAAGGRSRSRSRPSPRRPTTPSAARRCRRPCWPSSRPAASSARCTPASVACASAGGHRQVAGQDVVERRDVGRALDRRVAAQGQDPAARAADVAQQQLDDRGGADVLHADRVLGPADGVAEARSCARGPSSSHSASHTSRNSSRETPQVSSTSSGV